MTNKEIQDKLKKAKNKEWFKSVTVKFNFPHLNVEIEKIGFFDIYQYVKRECREWGRIDFRLPNNLEHSKQAFDSLKSSLEIFINNYINEDEYTLNAQWPNSSNQILAIQQNKRFPINNPHTKFLIEIHKISSDHYQGAYNYFFNTGNIRLTTAKQFAGAIMAYEFQFEDATLIPKRRNAERSSNSRLRNDFEKAFTETSQRVNAFLENRKKNAQLQTKEILELVKQKKEAYEKWVEQCKQNDQDYSKYQLQRVKELEELYQEKLKLEAPAQYWKNRSAKLRGEGDIWLRWLVGVTIVAVISLATVLFFISDGTLKDLFDKTGSAIRWSIVFVTFVSFLAYGIRTFAKLMFSAYHLHRDAEEREQLAYVYLALKKEQNIDETERHLIMQSLFSRADSGLLKDDSSPTMPGGTMIEKLMGGK